MDDTTDMELNFKEAIEKIPEIRPGESIMAKIVEITQDGILVDLGLKYEGLVPRVEFERRGIPKDFAVGTKIPVMLGQGYLEGHRLVSYSSAQAKVVWNNVLNAHKSGQPVEGSVIKKIQGGYIVDIGIDAFMPASHVDIRALKSQKNSEIKTLEKGAMVNVIVTEVDFKKKSAVVSHKKYAELMKKLSSEKIFSTIKTEDVIEGRVTSLTDFGAFVDIGDGVEGLLHISDMAWNRVEKSGDVVKTGDCIKVKVLKINKTSGKISLGLKHLTPHPWEKVGEKYFPGMVIKGKVTSITGFGAFVEVEPGVEGLLHISEVSWTQKPADMKKLLKVGDTVEVKIIEVDPAQEKLSLSIKQIGDSPWQEFMNKYPGGTKIKCKVTNLVPFGAFVELPNNLEGLIHIQDMSWTKKIRHPQEVVNVGDEIEAVLLEVKPGEEKASLSIKHLKENPFEKFAVGKVILGKVTKIIDFGAYIKLDDEIEAFMHRSEISREKGKHPAELLNIGQDVEIKVIKSDATSRKIDVSIKRLEIDRERELVSKYSGKQKQQLSDILEEEES
ncbi:MAG: S1 RNA-binding domain-containing protein [Elusimicrobiota bacterium]